MGKYKDLTITHTLTDIWYNLEPDVRAQHMLSNSELYQRVKLMEEVVNKFCEMEEQHEQHSETQRDQ